MVAESGLVWYLHQILPCSPLFSAIATSSSFSRSRFGIDVAFKPGSFQNVLFSLTWLKSPEHRSLPHLFSSKAHPGGEARGSAGGEARGSAWGEARGSAWGEARGSAGG